MRSILSLFTLLLLLTFASQCTWCFAAGRFTMADAAAAHHHHLRPHLQVHQEMRATEGQKLMEVQSSRKLGHGSVGGGVGGGGAGGGGRTSGGGAANTRPHNNKNAGAVAMPALVTSILALIFTGAALLPTFSF